MFYVVPNQQSSASLASYEMEATPYPWSETYYRDSLDHHLVYNTQSEGRGFCGALVVQALTDETHLLNMWVRSCFGGQGAAQFSLLWLVRHHVVPVFPGSAR